MKFEIVLVLSLANIAVIFGSSSRCEFPWDLPLSPAMSHLIRELKLSNIWWVWKWKSFSTSFLRLCESGYVWEVFRSAQFLCLVYRSGKWKPIKLLKWADSDAATSVNLLRQKILIKLRNNLRERLLCLANNQAFTPPTPMLTLTHWLKFRLSTLSHLRLFLSAEYSICYRWKTRSFRAHKIFQRFTVVIYRNF